jgi:hypothetical protein
MAGEHGSDSDRPYEVGYGKPPKNTRFQPGRSGNPRGRPKGRASLAKIVEKQLYRPMAVKVEGKSERLPALDVAIMRLMQHVLQAPPGKAISSLKFLLANLPETPEAGNFDYSKLSLEELHQLEALCAKASGVPSEYMPETEIEDEDQS